MPMPVRLEPVATVGHRSPHAQRLTDGRYSLRNSSGTIAASLELRSVSEVLTLRTCGAPVSSATKAWNVVEVRRDAFQDEVDLARQHPALAHQRLRAHESLERREVGLGLARQVHHGEDRDLVAEQLLVEQRRGSP